MNFYERLASDTQIGNIAELYEMSKSGVTYYYTSHNENVVHDGITYYSKVIQRGNIESQFSSMAVSCRVSGPTDEAFSIFVDRVPVSDVRLTITAKILDTGETQQLFYGTLREYSIADYKCSASFQNRGATLVKEAVPKTRYQGPCNNALFDVNCTLSANDYRLGGSIVYTSDELPDLEPRQLVLSDGFADSFGETLTDKPDAYLIGGTVMFNGHYRDISGAGLYAGGNIKITMQYAFPEGTIEVGTLLYLWPGCNKSVNHCSSRFNNVVHFSGFPYMPNFEPSSAVI